MAKNTSDEKKIEEGKSALRRDYYANVKSIATDILGDASEEFEHYDDAQEWLSERVHENVDGSYWVIYPHAALDTLQASENWLAIEDVGMEIDGDNFSQAITVAAFYALERDVMEEIERREGEYFTEREGNPRRGAPDKNPKKNKRTKKTSNPGRVPSKASLLR